ncbi:GNAT family N-acetyltransferase [Chryseobacterium sp. JUb7]|uniref:GNAT family N-acetyltransferase n=1 Tax=Chryseobacterium sp. JUb7 TaxID=2940599 RepID=UPI00216945A1|nr:GNAT family N-acetyltransferase [Chryseobacterium sp. JUb7]MCS3529867.1 putative GNAT family acetyltransferase [Chryseobacterium sp. JUb7]
MKQEFENIPLINTGSRFEIEFNGHLAFIDYREMGSQIALNHTEADLLISGTVVEKTLHYIEDHQKKALPFCPYVASFIKKNPEWKRVVDERFHGYDQL